MAATKSRPSPAAALLLALLAVAATSNAYSKLVSIPSSIDLLSEVTKRLDGGSHEPLARSRSTLSGSDDDSLLDGILASITTATRAFLWAFPLINTAPNAIKNGVTKPSTMNRFIWETLPNNASYSSIVTPNVNVLYGPGFFDLTKGPINITVPDTADRYYVLQCMDFWGITFTRIGFSVTGTGPGNYTLVGPDYNGTLKPNMFQSDTFGVWIMGRIAVINQNASDIAIADELLPMFKVAVPRMRSSPIYSSTTKAAKLWDKFLKNDESESFWKAYNEMVPLNQPTPRMKLDLLSFHSLGVTANGVNWAALTADQKRLLDWGASIGWQFLQQSSAQSNITANSSSVLLTSTNWKTSPTIGSPNNTVVVAAIISYAYVAGNIPAEAVYWTTYTDKCGQPFSIGKNYTFELASRPPYRAFWSMTLYNTSTFYLIPTTNNTYTLGSQFPAMHFNSNGGAALYLSQQPPSNPSLQGNWLPLGLPSTPADEGFYLIFRIYSPEDAQVVYDYAPPFVQVVDANNKPLPC